jgi:hypothetical protein
LELPRSSILEPISAPNSDSNIKPLKPVSFEAGRQSWKITLEPYGVQAVRVATTGIKVVEVRGVLNAAGQGELIANLKDLANRDLSAPSEYRALPNPSFESLNGPLVGWRLRNPAAGANVELDATLPQDGKTSLYLHGQQTATVESDPFPTPATGQLAMSVYARGDNLGPNAELKLIFETEVNGKTSRKSAAVKAPQLQQNQQWGRPFAIYVNDLPLNSRGTMRIVFELTGPGEVWLDNIKLYDLLCPLKFYPTAQEEILKLLRRGHDAQTAFDEGQVVECLGMLDGYWPHFVKTYTPRPVPKVAALPAAPSGQPSQQAGDSGRSLSKPNEGEQPVPGIGDRIKRMVPILR